MGTDEIRDLDVSEAGEYVAILAEKGVIHLVDKERCAEVSHYTPNGARIQAIKFVGDGTRLAGIDAEGIVRIWESSSGEEQVRFAQLPETAFIEVAPDGNRLAA